MESKWFGGGSEPNELFTPVEVLASSFAEIHLVVLGR